MSVLDIMYGRAKPITLLQVITGVMAEARAMPNPAIKGPELWAY